MITWQRSSRFKQTAATLLAAFMLLGPSVSYAACSNPSGNQGDIVYNTSVGVFQGCKADNTWQALHNAPAANNGPSSGLVFHWKLDETSGTTAADSSGNGYNGTAKNGASFTNDSVAGIIQKGIDLNRDVSTCGTRCEFVTSPGNLPIDNSTGATFSVWVKPSVDNPIGSRLIWYGMAGNNGYWMQPNSSGDLNWVIRTSVTTYSVTASSVFQKDQWVHLTGTWDGGANMALYVNGALAASRSDLSGTITLTWGVVIGNRDYSTEQVQAVYDDVWVYDRALSASEVQELYDLSCHDPFGVQGEIFYNTADGVFQGCTASGWVALHSAPASPTCPVGYTNCGGRSDRRLAFATSTAANWPNLSNSKSMCTSLAAAAGLYGTYLPWYSTASFSPATDFERSTVPYVRTNGTIYANDWADLTDGALNSPLGGTELNVGVSSNFGVYTWTNTDGTFNDTATCGNGNGRGQTNLGGSGWTATNLGTSCSNSYRRYCFEQGGCANPTGEIGEVMYNTTDDVFQGCTAAGWVALHKF